MAKNRPRKLVEEPVNFLTALPELCSTSRCAHECPHIFCISGACELYSLMVPPLAAHVRRFLLTSDGLSCTGHPSAQRGDDRAYFTFFKSLFLGYTQIQKEEEDGRYQRS